MFLQYYSFIFSNQAIIISFYYEQLLLLGGRTSCIFLYDNRVEKASY